MRTTDNLREPYVVPGDLFAPLISRLSLFLSIPAPLYYLCLIFFCLSYRSFSPLLSIYYLSQRRAWFTSWSASMISESKKSRSKSKPQSACLEDSQLIKTIRRGCSPPMSNRRRPLRYLSLSLRSDKYAERWRAFNFFTT